MGYVPGYENDVFISYAHVDNDPIVPGKPGWVDFFEELLRRQVRVRQRGDLQFFRDQQLRLYGQFSDQLAEKLASSAVLICIQSPNYVESDWCLWELEQFCKQAGSDRIIKVVKTHFDKQSLKPDAQSRMKQIEHVLDSRFYARNESTGLIEDLLPEIYEEHLDVCLRKIQVIAQNLVELFKKLSIAPTDSASAIQQALPKTLLSKIISDEQSVKGALMTKDGKLITVNSDWEVTLLPEILPRSEDGDITNHPKTGEKFQLNPVPVKDAQLRSLAITPDGKYLAIGQDNGKLQLGDIDSLKKGPGAISHLHGRTISRVAFSGLVSNLVSNDEYYLASSSVSWSSAMSHTKGSMSDKKWKKPDLPARIADLIAGTKYVKLVTAIAFSPDKQLVAMGREDGIVEIRDTKNGKLKFNWRAHKEQVFGLVFSPSNDRLVSVSEDKTAKLWCIARSDPIALSNPCKELPVKPANPGFLEIRTGLSRDFDATPRKPEKEFKDVHSLPVSGAAFSSDGKLLVTVGYDGAIAIWDFDKFGKQGTSPLVIIKQAHKGRVTGVSFKAGDSSKGKYQLITFSADDKTTRLWELPDIERLREINELITKFRDMELGQKEATNEELQRAVNKAMSLLPFRIPLEKWPDKIEGLFSEEDYDKFLQKLIPLANSENGTVQGAVATWWTRKSLPTKRQVATAPCTVPIRQRYQKLGDSTYDVVWPRALWFPNPQKQTRLEERRKSSSRALLSPIVL